VVSQLPDIPWLADCRNIKLHDIIILGLIGLFIEGKFELIINKAEGIPDLFIQVFEPGLQLCRE
jgi:hypothetical protein